MSCADWLESAEAEARTGIRASGLRVYPNSVEQLADAGDISGVETWLEGGGHIDARSSEPHGYTLLMVAAETGNAELVQSLINRKASVDLRCRNDSGLTALMIAAQDRNEKIVGALLEAGADSMLQTRVDYGEGETALHMAEKDYGDDDDLAQAQAYTVSRLYEHEQRLTPLSNPPEPTYTPFVLLTSKLFAERYRQYEDEGFTRRPLLLALQHHAPASLVKSIVHHHRREAGGEAGFVLLSKVLSQAVALGVPADVLAVLCAANPASVSVADEDQLTPLHHAALARNPAALRVLLDVAPLERLAEAPGGSPLHLLARGPRTEPKRLKRPDEAADTAAVEACEVLLAAYSDDERRERLLRCEEIRAETRASKKTPLHLAADYGAPPSLVLMLLAACPDAASVMSSDGNSLPCHSISGKHATEATAKPLEALLAAHPPSAEWSLTHLLCLGAAPGAAEATLARLASHGHEAREMDPVPPGLDDHPNSPWHQQQRVYRRYPLHRAAMHAAPRAVVAELIRLCPDAVRKQTWLGFYPLHEATLAAGRLFQGQYGCMLRRAPPAEGVATAATDCVELLLEAWPAGATACDKLHLEPGCSKRRQEDGYGWWPLHTALSCHAPEALLDKLRAHTPVDAFGNPKVPNPGKRGATKMNRSDVRKLLKDDTRSRQLRFLCEGAEGAPPRLMWTKRDRWGMPNRGDRTNLEIVPSVDPSTENVHSLEPFPPEEEEGEEGEEEEADESL